jgi:6,7-dimethyl-8-ribityllumazine synthase
MATQNKNLSLFDKADIPSAKGMRFGIVVANWNIEITSNLLDGAKETLLECGALASNISVMEVPGSFELIFGAKIIAKKEVNAVICLGSVIQGETKHFDFVCNAVSSGIKNLNVCGDVPIIFGVLTDNTLEEAKDRSGGKHGNKGVEAAITAIKMAHLNR